MRELIRCAWRELGRRKRRAAATTAGFALAALILFSVGNLLCFSRQTMSDILYNVGTHIIVSVPATGSEMTSAASGPWPIDSLNEAFYSEPNVVTQLLLRALASELAGLPAVLCATPLMLYRVKDSEKGFLFSIAGFDPKDKIALDNNLCSEKDIIAGTFIRSGDRGVAVVTDAFSITTGITVGSSVKISGISFPVIGIIKPGINPGKADVFLCLDDAVSVINPRLRQPMGDRVNSFLVEVKHGRQMEEAVSQIRGRIPDCLVNTFFCSVSAIRVLGMNEGAVWILLAIVLVGVTLYAMSSQWSSIVERRRDIGILKAIGWSDSEVVWQLGLESVIQSLLGGSIGCGLGFFFLAIFPVPAWISNSFSWNGELAGIVFLVGIVVSLFCGVVAGAVPAFYSARQTPAESIRSK